MNTITDTAETMRPMKRAPYVLARLKLRGNGPRGAGGAADITEQYWL